MSNPDCPENHARLSGLLAVLALPLVRGEDGAFRRRRIEIKHEGAWIAVEGAAVELGRLTLWAGRNGSSRLWDFDANECPQWRCDTPRSHRETENPQPRTDT